MKRFTVWLSISFLLLCAGIVSAQYGGGTNVNIVTVGNALTAAANNVIGWNNGATAPENKAVLGTASQITVTHGANTITFSIPASPILGTSASNNSAVTNTLSSAPSTTDVAGASLAIQPNKGSGTTYGKLQLAPSGGAVVLGVGVTPAASGVRYLCIGTDGTITSSATTCTGT